MEQRKLEGLSLSVTLLTNLAVVASIIFLGIQVRQTTIAVRGATYQQRAIQEEEWGKFLADSDNLRPAITRYAITSSFDSLSTVEQHRLQDLGLAAAKRLDGVFYQNELGLLDDDYFRVPFRRQMSIWVPRWDDFRMLDYVLAEVRPTFADYITQFEGGPVSRAVSPN
jgi:hypothetical protein